MGNKQILQRGVAAAFLGLLLGGFAEAAVSVDNVHAVQRSGSRLVDIYYDLESDNNCQCKVSATLYNNETLILPHDVFYAFGIDGDFGEGVNPGVNRHIVWNAGIDFPHNYSTKVNVEITAEETDVPANWVTIVISWAAYGGRDLDICAYWEDNESQRVGYSYKQKFSDLYWVSNDDTHSGPERVMVSCDGYDFQGKQNRKLRIHVNYYGDVGSPAKAEIAVKETDLRKETAAGTRTRNAAAPSDPGVTITFDRNGQPIGIDCID